MEIRFIYNKDLYNNACIFSVKKYKKSLALQDFFAMVDLIKKEMHESFDVNAEIPWKTSTSNVKSLSLMNFVMWLEQGLLEDKIPQEFKSSFREKILRNKIKPYIIDGSFRLTFADNDRNIVKCAEENPYQYYRYCTKDVIAKMQSWEPFEKEEIINYVSFKNYVDQFYSWNNKNITEFYLEKLYKTYKLQYFTIDVRDDGNKILVERQKNFAKKLIKENLIIPEKTDTSTDTHISFIKLLYEYVNAESKEKNVFDIFFSRVNNNYNVLKNENKDTETSSTKHIHKINVQFDQYIQQIALYIGIIKKLSIRYPVNAKLFDFILKMRNDLKFTFEDHTDPAQAVVIFNMKPLEKLIYLEMLANKKDSQESDIQKILSLANDEFTLKKIVDENYVNRLIALLNDLEKFYFRKLYFAFFMIIKNEMERKMV